MLIAYCLLPAACCLLPIAYWHCLLPNAYCLLPLADFLVDWIAIGLLCPAVLCQTRSKDGGAKISDFGVACDTGEEGWIVGTQGDQ